MATPCHDRSTPRMKCPFKGQPFICCNGPLTTQNRPWRNMPPIARFDRATYALEEIVVAEISNNFNGIQRKNGTV